MKLFIRGLTLAAGLSGVAEAGVIPFDNGWKEQGFSLFSSNDYTLEGGSMGVVSDGSVSMIFRAVPEADWSLLGAEWQWSVTQSVVATDLTTKGVDDRNLALYFVFVDPTRAKALSGSSARRVFNEESTRTLVYVWGGDYPQGQVLASPFQPGKLMIVAARPATTGSFSETVDLAADFSRAFGQPPGALIAVGVSADSDDTDAYIDARISGLRLR
ncbi:MAG: DUF3047 domain-containing protein [Rhodobacteraceae bacterium]|nr:DUF3047 domain-containing protein [Paracoccaceae bacterium]